MFYHETSILDLVGKPQRPHHRQRSCLFLEECTAKRKLSESSYYAISIENSLSALV